MWTDDVTQRGCDRRDSRTRLLSALCKMVQNGALLRRVAQLHAKNKPNQSHRIRPKNVNRGLKTRFLLSRCNA